MPRQDGTSYVDAGLSRKAVSLTGVLSQNAARTDTTATTGALTTVFTYTLPANTLNAQTTLSGTGIAVGGATTNAKGIRIRALFISTAAATSKVAAILFGGTAVVTSTAISTASSSIECEAYVVRTGTQTADCWGKSATTAGTVLTNAQALSGSAFNFSGAGAVQGAGIAIAFQVNHATASDVSLRSFTIELLTEGDPT